MSFFNNKVIKKSLYYLALFISGFILLLSLDFRPLEFKGYQNTNVIICKDYSDSNFCKTNYKNLETYKLNKIYPIEFENQILIALSHYPELKEECIEFKISSLKSSALMSRPTFESVILTWTKKKYIVFISDCTDNLLLQKCLFKKLPYNAQIGVLGHELSHISKYYEKTSLQMLTELIKYQFSKEYFNIIESTTDQDVISHSLGFQLLAWSNFQYYVKVQMGLGNAYLSPQKIKTEIKKNNLYKTFTID